MSLKPHPYNKFKLGKKTIEVRLLDEKRQQIKTGDLIEFTLEPEKTEKITVEVEALHNYKDIASLANDFPIESFGRSSIEELISAFQAHYTPEELSSHSVLGIKVTLKE